MKTQESPRLVGRGQQLRSLTRAVLDFAQGSPESPTLLSLGGDPGIGKTRLIKEVQEQLAGENLRWLSTRCAPHGLRHPWHPIRHLLRTLSGLEPEMPLEERQSRIEEWAHGEGLPGDVLDASRFLLSLPTRDPSWPDMAASDRRERLFATMRDLVVAIGKQKQTIFLLEDAHWIDPETLQWLDWALVQSRSRGKRVMAIVLHRMEFRHLWPARIQRMDVRLEPLSGRDSQTLLREILGLQADLPEPLGEKLVRQTGGNPFFMEEAIRLLLDRGLLERLEDGNLRLSADPDEFDLPESPRGLIEERVQRLERHVKHLLQCASVIGFEVRPGLLEHLIEAVSLLEAPISTLVDEMLLERREALHGLILLFRHAITHEVTYSTLLRQRREELHGRLGIHLEEIHRAHPDEAAELLAHHFGSSDLPEKAVRYLRLAAEQAILLCAHEAAEAHLQRLSEILTLHAHAIPDVDEISTKTALDRGKLARLRGDFASACELMASAVNEIESRRVTPVTSVRMIRSLGETERQRGRIGEAIKLHRRALGICASHNGQGLNGSADQEQEQIICLMGLGIALRVSGDLRGSLTLFDEAERRARALGQTDALASALNNRGICLLNMGHPRPALVALEKSVALRRELGDQRNLVATLNNLGIINERLLELDKALVIYAEALRLAYEIGHTRAVTANHINAGQLLQWLDNQPEAMRHFRSVLHHCSEHPDNVAQALALINLGWSHIHIREIEAVEPLLDLAEAIAKDTGDHSVSIHALLLRAMCALEMGNPARGLSAAKEAAERIERSGGGDEIPMALRLRALAEAALGRTDEINGTFRSAMRAARQTADRREQMLILLARAEIALRAGQRSSGRRLLRRAERALARHPVPLVKRFLSEVESV